MNLKNKFLVSTLIFLFAAPIVNAKYANFPDIPIFVNGFALFATSADAAEKPIAPANAFSIFSPNCKSKKKFNAGVNIFLKNPYHSLVFLKYH